MSGWKKVKLGDILQIKKGDYITKKEAREGVYPVILGGREPAYFIDKFNHTGKAIVVSRSGASAGFVSFWNEPIFVTDGFLVEPKKEVTYEFLYYALKSKQELLHKSQKGAAIPHVTPFLISDIAFLLPDSEIQHRIATILSRYNTLIENYQKQIKLLEEAAQRLYKEWFVDLRFPGYENVKMVDDLPEGWERKRLVDFAKVIMGQSPKSEYYNNENKGLPFHQGVGSYGNRFVVDDTYSTSYTRIAEPNSVLFSVRAPVGRLNITKNKIVIGRGLAAITHIHECQSFLFYLLKERFFKDNIIGNGAIFASISKDELLNLEFMIPSDDLIQSFNAIAGNMDDIILKTDNQIRLLAEARDRLLPRLMGGEIEVI